MKKMIPPLKYKKQTVYFQSSEFMSVIKKPIVDLIFTSPPYWNLKDYDHEGQIGLEDTYQTYLDRLNKVWDECYAVSKESALLAINIGTKRHIGKFYPIGMDIYKNMQKWKLVDRLIWYIPNALTQPAGYTNKLPDNKFEDVLIFAKNYDYKNTFNKIRVPQKYKLRDSNRTKKYHPDGRSIGNVIKIRAYRPPPIKKRNYHQAAFPEDLVHVMTTHYTNPGDVVLDPFVGSGTVLKLCRHMKRVGFGYEINTDYKDLIKDRINEDFHPPKWEELDLLHDPEKISDIDTNKAR